MAGYNAGLFQAGFNSAGKIEAASGSIFLGHDGLTLDTAGLAMNFHEAGTMYAKVGLRTDTKLSIMGVHGSPINLVSDPSFETSAAWTSSEEMRAEISEAQAHSGAKSLRIYWSIAGFSSDSVLSPQYAISGEAALIRFFVKLADGADRDFIGARWNGGPDIGVGLHGLRNTTEWQEAFMICEKPSGKTHISVYVFSPVYGFSGDSGELWIDDLQVFSLADKDVAEIAIDRDGTSFTGYTAYKKGPSVTLANGDNHNVAISADTNIAVTGPTAAFAVTGIAGGVDGRLLILRAGAQTMTIKNQNASSSVGNRIATLTGGDVSCGANAIATLIYDSGLGYWTLVSMRGATGAI